MTRKPDSASFEQRVRNFIEPLKQRGIIVTPFTLDKKLPRDLSGYDGLWWHRSILGFWSRRQLNRVTLPRVFDFDDPLMYSSAGGGKTSRTRARRFTATLKRMTAAMPASEHLRELASAYCEDSTVVPMACDLPDAPPRLSDRPGPTQLLWLGSGITQPYLEAIAPALDAVARARPDVSLRLVARTPMTFGAMKVDFRPWSYDQQEAALRECHVGLCPMPDTLWTRGKCPYKVLQYMAYAMAWVGSEVGENRRTAGEDERGLIARDIDTWREALLRLIDDAQLRNTLGVNARTFIEQHHSREGLADRIAALWYRLVK